MNCVKISTINFIKCEWKFTKKYSTRPVLPICNFKPKPYEGLSQEKLSSIRLDKINPALTTFYKQPLVLHQGYKQWLFDVSGKRYLDMFGGICTVSVGHCHPKITDAVKEQMSLLGHVSNIYMHPKIHEYAEKLTNKLPGDLKVVYFVNSGSEANDLAVLMARAYTGNFEIIGLKNCYHGMSYITMGLTGHSSYKHHVPNSGFHHVMNPDVFMGPWGGSKCRYGLIQVARNCKCPETFCAAKDKYIEQLKEEFLYCLPKGKIAGFFAESIQGVGGAVEFPRGYLKAAQKVIKENGGVFISDEVQTGFGRTGDHFWGFEMHEIQPDIVTMAKGIGNGFPLAAVVTTPEIAKSLNKAQHFNTFGGNPVSCAVGLTVLQIIEEEKLQENCKEIGNYILKELCKLKLEFPVVGDVRGKGLMIGVELVEKKGTTEPLNKEKFDEMFELIKDLGVLLGRGGVYKNVLRIKPPMCINKHDADFTVDVLRESLKMLGEKYDFC